MPCDPLLIGRETGAAWLYWADVPVRSSDTIAVTEGVRCSGKPEVKYCGIFINDEDWGFQPWAAKTLVSQLVNRDGGLAGGADAGESDIIS